MNKYADVSLIDSYAQRFSMNPDWVYAHAEFDTVMYFLEKWKAENDFQERYIAIVKKQNNPAWKP